MPETGDEISPGDPVDVVSGVGNARRLMLESEGYETVEDLQHADVSELDTFLPSDVSRSIKDQVGDVVENVPTVSEAKEKAQKIPGAKAKVVSDGNGRTRAKVLRKEDEFHVGGASVEIHRG